MSINEITDKLKESIRKYLIAKDAKYPKVSDSGEVVLIIPPVTSGCLPHSNFTFSGAGAEAMNEFFKAPYVMVGVSNGETDYSSSSFNVIIQACVHSAKNYEEINEDSNIPDNRAFEDVNSLIELIKNGLLRGDIKTLDIDYPIKFGNYNDKEITYPYGFGYIEFPVRYEQKVTKKFKY